MKNTGLVFILLSWLCFAACTGGKGQSANDTSQMKSFGNNSNSNALLGAGSAFVYPLFSKLFAEYAKETHVMVNYRSTGSGGGILQLTTKTIDFCDSDRPLSNEQVKKMGAPVLQITLFRRLAPGDSSDSVKSDFNRALIYKEQNYDGRNLMRAQKLLKMLWWTVRDGQKYCHGLDYAQLSPGDVIVAENILKSATFDGKPILQ